MNCLYFILIVFIISIFTIYSKNTESFNNEVTESFNNEVYDKIDNINKQISNTQSSITQVNNQLTQTLNNLNFEKDNITKLEEKHKKELQDIKKESNIDPAKNFNILENRTCDDSYLQQFLSLSKCSEGCESDPKCTSFTYNNKTGECNYSDMCYEGNTQINNNSSVYVHKNRPATKMANYKRIKKMCYDNKNITPIKKNTINDCATACDTNNACLGFVYDNKKMCNMSKNCWENRKTLQSTNTDFYIKRNIKNFPKEPCPKCDKQHEINNIQECNNTYRYADIYTEILHNTPKPKTIPFVYFYRDKNYKHPNANDVCDYKFDNEFTSSQRCFIFKDKNINDITKITKKMGSYRIAPNHTITVYSQPDYKGDSIILSGSQREMPKQKSCNTKKKFSYKTRKMEDIPITINWQNNIKSFRFNEGRI